MSTSRWKPPPTRYSRSPAPVSVYGSSSQRGGTQHLWWRISPRPRTSPCPTGSLPRARHFSTSRWPYLAASAHVRQSHGHPFARAHFSTSRWPPFAAFVHVNPSHGRHPGSRPLQHGRWPYCRAAHVRPSHGQSFSRAHFSVSRWPPCRVRARPPVPRAAVLARPLQHLEVAGSLPAARARPPVPRAVVLARPLQHLEVAVPRRVRARPLVPRADVLARPLQHLEIAAPRHAYERRPACPTENSSLATPSTPRAVRSSLRRTGTLVPQNTSRVPVLQQAHVSELHRYRNIRQLLYRTPRRVHGVAHR